MGAKAKKLKWDDVEDIAFKLIDAHPRTNPKALSLVELNTFVVKLRDFGDSSKKSNEGTLKLIKERWYDERMDMDDELGPVVSESAKDGESDDNLDEEHFRADRESLAALGDDDDEEEEEHELDDGFQKEEM